MGPFGRPVHLAIAGLLALGIAAAPRLAAQAAKEPGTVVLKGAPIGGVKFEHKLHAHDRKIACDGCHHKSKPEKPLTSEFQACSDCHTKTVAPPMKTKAQAAFHDGMAKKGVCVDCHVKNAAKAKAMPAKCPDCHKKENK
jgi:Zn finger protein HypA/HybF involved in hydrogenase expression